MTKTKDREKITRLGGSEPLGPLPDPSRAQLEERRAGVVATGPSGATYRIRKINLERHAMSGGLPTNLRRAAMKGVEGLEELLGSSDGDGQGGSETRDYLDRLVLATVVEPQLEPGDLGTGELEDDPLLPAIDYGWLVKVATGEELYDAEGMRLWGREPLDRFATFRAFHGCDESCQGCDGFRTAVAAHLGASTG